MPRYYLHLHNMHLDAPDHEGVEVIDLQAAKSAALAGVRGFLAAEVARGSLDLRGRIDIADDEGKVVLTVPFSDAVTIILP